jgi:hypothetical protein
MGDTAKNKTFFNSGNVQPLIHGSLYPAGHWDCAHMTTFTKQVNDRPVIISLLEVRQLQPDQLCTPQAAAQQESQDRMISFAFCVPIVRGFKKPAPLSAGKPVPEPRAEFLRTFNTPDARSEIRLSKPLSEAS